jgi:hypothetical protein
VKKRTKTEEVRRVTYIDAVGNVGQQFAVRDTEGVFRFIGWYVFDYGSRNNERLRVEDEGVRWSWGWKTKSARVLRVKAALT